MFGSATETFAQRNLHCTWDEQFSMFVPTIRRAAEAGLNVRGYVSMCLAIRGRVFVPIERVVETSKRLLDLGIGQLSLGDTIGVGTVGTVTALLDSFTEAGIGDELLAMHFHDTYGQALTNAYAALQHG